MKKKGPTAKELMDRLNADPEFVAAAKAREREKTAKEEQLTVEQQPLITELQKVGIAVSSAWDLVNTSTPYPKALPILLEHLKRPYSAPVREGIARALAVRDAKFGWESLRQCYVREEDGRAKDGLAAALAASADDDVIGDLVVLAKDTRHGSSRLLFLRALARSQDARAAQSLVELADDRELQKEILIILGEQKQKTH